ncbi:MAG: hypothetical protein KAR79_03800, partial [Simkaniaceae bacterium]|nr:hypothetical protein [Simkaniaceae bacterium]
MNIKLYALLPCLNTEVGHIYEYCCSASKAASMSGWKLVGVIPKSCAINNLPDHWIKTLSFDPWDEKRGFLPRIFTVIKNIHPFFRLLKIAKKDSDTQAIFFIEHGLQHLFGLIIALSLTSYRPELWILHRYTYDTQKTRASIYKFFHKILQWQLGRKKIKLMTDSDLLAKAQQKLFCSKIFLLPIPHTPLNLDSQLRKKPSKHLLWWPGGSIREEKGLNLVQMLANHLTPNMQLILAEKARPFFHPETKHLHFIK